MRGTEWVHETFGERFVAKILGRELGL